MSPQEKKDRLLIDIYSEILSNKQWFGDASNTPFYFENYNELSVYVSQLEEEGYIKTIKLPHEAKCVNELLYKGFVRYYELSTQQELENKLIEHNKGVIDTLQGTHAALKMFISYARADEILKKELLKQLKPLEKSGKIAVWADQDISSGDEWEKEIYTKLTEANIILLLISSDFINSDYCYDNEMKNALTRHHNNEAIVIPIILRPCQWQKTPLGKLQALPTNAQPITQWNDQDTAFDDVARQMIKLVDKIKKYPNNK